jgi:hypothetical protein
MRGRVVAHAIADIPSAYAGSGQSATQAFYYFLRRRMNLQVIPTGYGLTPPAVAGEEGWRAGARAVVMARLQNVEYRQQSLVTRLEVVVVREGRPVLRRIIESGPVDWAGANGLRRSRTLDDPIFQAILQSLDSIVPSLSMVVADLR